mgnify:CR=1 FL=1
MKKIIFILISFLLISCSKNKKETVEPIKEIPLIEEKTETDINNVDDLDKDYLSYIKLLNFINKRKDYFTNSQFKEENIDKLMSQKLISINNYEIQILDSELSYFSGDMLKGVQENLKDVHYVSFQSNSGRKGIYNVAEDSFDGSLLQPLETKEDCLKLIKILEELKYNLRFE